MPKKKVEFPSEKDDYEEVWDFRKIAIGVVIVIILLIGGYIAKRLILGESLNPSDMIPKMSSFNKVLGTSTDVAKPVNVSFSLPTQDAVQQQVKQIQQQVTHLNIQEIASSSPEVKQILQQIQSLPNQTSDQAKQMCYRLCNNL